MKRIVTVLLAAIFVMTLSACSSLPWNVPALKDSMEIQLKNAGKVVFTNKKEKTLRITVSDTRVIGQIASIIGKRKVLEESPGVDGDYDIVFYLTGGQKVSFTYWMGSTENNREVNFSDESGRYYRVPETMDLYIVNSTKMLTRPQKFTDLYSSAISECISQLDKVKDGETTVGVDITSDRRMRKYTMSYEDEKIFKGISAEGYKIFQLEKDGKYTYILSYVTNIYNTNKAIITFEALRTGDNTVKSVDLEYKLNNEKWQLVENKK